MRTSSYTNFNLVRGEVFNNWEVLEQRAQPENTHRLILLEITDYDAQNGEPGKVHSCAAALAAKDHWGAGCRPTVKEIRGEIILSISNHETQQRYNMELGIIKMPGGFDPELFDNQRRQGLTVRGGTVLIKSVTVEPTRSNQPKPKKRYPHADRTMREPRKWTTIPIKGRSENPQEINESPRFLAKFQRPQQAVIDTLNGERS